MENNKNDNVLSAELILTIASMGVIFGTKEAIKTVSGDPAGILTNIYMFLACSIGFGIVFPAAVFLIYHIISMFSGNNALIGLIIVFICCAAYFFLTIY